VWTLTLVFVTAVWMLGRFAAAHRHSSAHPGNRADLARKDFPTAPETAAAGAICFRPGTPDSFIRTTRGYTVNLGIRRIQWAAA
jgi:hypothetical protein